MLHKTHYDVVVGFFLSLSPMNSMIFNSSIDVAIVEFECFVHYFSILKIRISSVA